MTTTRTASTKTPLSIRQGSTFNFVFRWETQPIVYRPITGILAQAPVRVTVPAHGIPEGWRVAVVSVRGMLEMNALNAPPRDADYHQATVIGVDTIELNDVNAADFSAYESGGYVQFNTPADLAAYTARMRIKDRVGGVTLLTFTTENGRIVLDNSAKTITLTLSATDSEALAFTKGQYDLEMVSPTGVVTPLAEGPVTVTREITTTT